MGKKKKERTIVVAVFSDTHCGSTLGLCPPVVNLDDEGGTYRVSKSQHWLWRQWWDFQQQVFATVKKHKAKLVVVSNGDVTEGNHHHTRAVIGGGNETLQMRIAEECLTPLLNEAEEVYFTRGTPAHVKGQAALEEKIAQNWANTHWQHEGAATWYQIRLEANGTLFDIAHHGQLGRLEWTKANPLGKIAAQAVIRAYNAGIDPPDVLIRSHLHQYANSHDNYPVQVIATPAWQLITGYVHRVSPGSVADIGGLIFVCYPGGKYECTPVRYQPEPDPVQRIEI